MRIIDRRFERQRADRTDARNAHEARARLIPGDHRDHHAVQPQIFSVPNDNLTAAAMATVTTS
jgi:hypothetical protein